MDAPPEHRVPPPRGPLAESSYASRDNFIHLLLGVIATVERLSARWPGAPGPWPGAAAGGETPPSGDDRGPLLR